MNNWKYIWFVAGFAGFLGLNPPAWGQDYLDIDPHVLKIMEKLGTAPQEPKESQEEESQASGIEEEKPVLKDEFTKPTIFPAPQIERIKEVQEETPPRQTMPVNAAPGEPQPIKKEKPAKKEKKLLRKKEKKAPPEVSEIKDETPARNPMVVSAAKKSQPQREAPAAVTVITREDIRQMGSIHLWDVVRQVAGVDVVTSTLGQGEVSVRGFGGLGSNKTLILVDGRSVYLPIQGVFLWEMLPVQFEEIERIEIIKGPMASLYGPNANLGLINIITKKPEELDGGIVSQTVGSQGTTNTSFVYGEKKGNLGYKVSTGGKSTDSFDGERDDALDTIKGNTFFEYSFAGDRKLALSSGISQGTNYYLFNQTLTNRNAFVGPMRNTDFYLRSDYESGDFQTRFFWNYYHALWQTGLNTIDLDSSSIDLQSQYSYKPDDKNSVIFGGGTHLDYTKSEELYSPTDSFRKNQTLWNVFVQDDYRISDEFSLNASVRWDHSLRTDYNPSAKAALLYVPNERDTYRVSAGYSYRDPSLAEYYVNLPLVLVPSSGTASFLGKSDLEAEKYTTYDAGYQGMFFGGKLRPSADIFLTQVDDIISTIPIGTGPLGLDEQFMNKGSATAIGGELGGEYDLNGHCTLLSSYALNHIDYETLDAQGFKFFSPKHKANLGVKIKMLNNRLAAKLMANYVSSAENHDGGLGPVPAYVFGDLWMGYRITGAVEASVAGYNLFYNDYPEIAAGDELGTQFLGKLEVRF